jgi:phage terminase large subunit-like protein
MANLVNVVEGSMGPRREPMTVITTTAGRVIEGPYEVKLRGIKEQLLEEMNYPLDGTAQPTDNDWQFALICCPDQWEENDEDLQRPEVWRKVNRHIGITVQPDFYENEWRKMLQDPEKKKEQITKLFNVWQSGRVTEWIKGDRIRPLQTPKRITDCRYDDGWNVFVGLDFSHGDDLFAITYLAVNYRHDHPLQGRFFADCEAWVLEETMKTSPNRSLYERWAEDGWLNICPGEVFDSMIAMQRLAEKHEQGINMVLFGYDPAQSVNPINNLKAWLQTLGIDGQTVTSMVVPVGQSAMTQNPRVSEVEDLVKSQEQLLQFSMSPLWPWCFGNCAVETNSSDLRRVLKGGPAASAKIDPVAALIDALYCFDLSEGRVEK